MMNDRGVVNEPSFVLFPGDTVSIVVDTKTYRGTLMNDNGRWYVKVLGADPGEEKEVVIAKL